MSDARPFANGRVTLIGAGPGDPDLLTVRAVDRLADADLVLYDALSSPEARKLAPEARWFFVGKRAGGESIAQETICRMMVREARRGRHVVRLKSGDPFVFGRGGEEAIALAEAGIPCEIVPGVSSAVAAPALAGIPVTHRKVASAFVVLSGHADEAWMPVVDSLAPGSATLVVLMGKRARAKIAARLMERGWSKDMPAALILGASTPRSWRWTGPLAELGSVEEPAAAPETDATYGMMPSAPGVLVIGDVVALAARIAADAQCGDVVSQVRTSHS